MPRGEQLDGHPRVRLGPARFFGIGAEIVCLEDGAPLELGDCARIGDGVRIVLGKHGARFGDYCTLHEHTLVMARGRIEAGHNTWVGRGSLLDGTGGLYMGDGVRIGAGSQVWTHAEAGEELEGSMLNFAASTHIGDGAWLVGRVDVNPGVRIAERSVVANGSLVARSLSEPWSLYAGNPVRRMPYPAWKRPTEDERWLLMCKWLREFGARVAGRITRYAGHGATRDDDESAEYCTLEAELGGGTYGLALSRSGLGGIFIDPSATVIDVSTSRYKKRFTPLEIHFLRWLDGRRARFIPIQEDQCAT